MKKNDLKLAQPDPEGSPNYFTDQDGNEYAQSTNLETWTCKLITGGLGSGWTAEEAYRNASDEKRSLRFSADKIVEAYEISQKEKDLQQIIIAINRALDNYKNKEADSFSLTYYIGDKREDVIHIDRSCVPGILELFEKQIIAMIDSAKIELKNLLME